MQALINVVTTTSVNSLVDGSAVETIYREMACIPHSLCRDIVVVLRNPIKFLIEKLEIEKAKL